MSVILSPIPGPLHSVNILIFNNKYYGHPTHGEYAEPVPQGRMWLTEEMGRGVQGSGLRSGLGQVPWGL